MVPQVCRRDDRGKEAVTPKATAPVSAVAKVISEAQIVCSYRGGFIGSDDGTPMPLVKRIEALGKALASIITREPTEQEVEEMARWLHGKYMEGSPPKSSWEQESNYDNRVEYVKEALKHQARAVLKRERVLL